MHLLCKAHGNEVKSVLVRTTVRRAAGYRLCSPPTPGDLPGHNSQQVLFLPCSDPQVADQPTSSCAGSTCGGDTPYLMEMGGSKL